MKKGIRQTTSRTLATQDGLRPRSPSEALEPGRAPVRPHGKRLREPNKKVSGAVRFMSGVLTLVLFAAVFMGGTVLLIYHLYERPGPLKDNQVVVIQSGKGRTEIARHLEDKGVISNRWAFILGYLGQRYFGERKSLELKAGEYEIKSGASMRQVLNILATGKSVGYNVVVPEGLTSQQIVERLNADPSLTGEITKMPVEGSLAPDTYNFTKGTDRNDIINRMEVAQAENLYETWQKRQKGLPFKTKEEAQVLASIVEKETGRSDERAMVAAVFVNRLRKGMRLQSDPTILYGLYGGAVQWGKPILKKEKRAKNAHNTYQIKGLPPTPICNPGVAALEAVLNPADTKAIYFVADGTGGHVFSKTLKEHNAAVANWRKIEKDIRAKQAAAAKEREKLKANVEAASKESESNAASDTAKPQAVVITVPDGKAVPEAGADQAIPNPPAGDAKGEAAGAAPAARQASTVPLPIRKPKR